MTFECPSWPPEWPEIDAAVRQVVRSGDWGRYHSQACRDLQERIVEISGVLDARLCCSGTAALEIALRAAQIGAGDEVVLAAYDFPGNFRTVELLGARPFLLDVAPDSLGVDPEQLESLVASGRSGRIRAVIASHLYGRAADVIRLRQICDRHQWVLIEDACQALGMRIAGRPAGSLGHVGTLSFGGSKPVSAGGGGAVLVNTSRLAARLGALIDRPGEVYPLSPLQAAVIGPQLDRLAELGRIRLATVQFLQDEVSDQLESWAWQSGIQANHVPTYYKVAWLAQSQEQRNRILAEAERENLPMGAGFRSLSRCSDRRCGKPFPTPRSDLLGDRLFVLDHRALILPSQRYPQLAQSLRRVFTATA